MGHPRSIRRRTRTGRGADVQLARRSASIERSSSVVRARRSARRCAILCEPQTVTRSPLSSLVYESVRSSDDPHTAHALLVPFLRSRFPIRMPAKVTDARAKGQLFEPFVHSRPHALVEQAPPPYLPAR